MTKVLLHRSYKARKPGVILDIPQAEADGLVTLGIGEILKEEHPAPKKKGERESAE
ncbi:hypothetical protein [Rhizobium phaseoli]|uniref:hypothetical protein n=1 Tax=Rhizobium phaseoli TaxID=396 RepID=UPI0002F97590|nr:hypothetical protein [Rhizobium phaseoli]KKZ89063.1 hypothetical protein RPHASCH2410_CH00270 [Rhizobium phaseoli Ch24-10]